MNNTSSSPPARAGERNKTSRAWLVHGFGICLLLGRLSHAFGVSQPKENFVFRIFGMAMTFATLLGASAVLLYAYA